MKSYPLEEVLRWHEKYLDMRNTVNALAREFGIKNTTLVTSFKRYGLWVRPSGFRAGNCRGKDGQDNLRLRYLWFFKFAYKRRAKRKGLEVTITEDEFISLVTSDCYYCGKDWQSETRQVNKRDVPMLTIDRIDSTKGYIKENCVSCCKTCNTIKMDIPYDEWMEHIRRIVIRHDSRGK